MSFGSRLKERRNELNITQPQLAEMLGVSQSAVGSWETNVNSPRATLLYDLFEILKCDANYLFQDEMDDLTYKNKATPEEFENLIKKYRELDASGKEAIAEVIKKELARVTELKKRDMRIQALETALHEKSTATRIYPYLHKIACAGTGFYFDDIPTDTIEAPYMNGADFVIGVNGDSMEPNYKDGENLYVQKTGRLNFGEVGIFTVNNECYLKEYGEEGLISQNKDYPDIPGDENVRLVGKVIGKVNENR